MFNQKTFFGENRKNPLHKNRERISRNTSPLLNRNKIIFFGRTNKKIRSPKIGSVSAAALRRWPARPGSNRQSLESESNALSIVLRAEFHNNHFTTKPRRLQGKKGIKPQNKISFQYLLLNFVNFVYILQEC